MSATLGLVGGLVLLALCAMVIAVAYAKRTGAADAERKAAQDAADRARVANDIDDQVRRLGTDALYDELHDRK